MKSREEEGARKGKGRGEEGKRGEGRKREEKGGGWEPMKLEENRQSTVLCPYQKVKAWHSLSRFPTQFKNP